MSLQRDQGKRKAVVIGASGTIGSAVSDILESKQFEVIRASRKGPAVINLEDRGSIDAFFSSLSEIDALIVTAGNGRLVPLDRITEDEIAFGMKSKALGQMDVVIHAIEHLRESGSITITGGNMFENLIPGSGVSAFVNQGLEGFVRAAATELPRGIRLNIVSPGWVKETLEGLDPETRESLGLANVKGMAASDVAQAYLKAVEGTMKGETLYP